MKRIIVALDVPSLQEATQLVLDLREEVAGFKAGLQLCTAEGVPNICSALYGVKVMLDLKLHVVLVS